MNVSCTEESIQLNENTVKGDITEIGIVRPRTGIVQCLSNEVYLIQYLKDTQESKKEEIRESFRRNKNIRIDSVTKCPNYLAQEIWYICILSGPKDGDTLAVIDSSDPVERSAYVSSAHVINASNFKDCDNFKF